MEYSVLMAFHIFSYFYILLLSKRVCTIERIIDLNFGANYNKFIFFTTRDGKKDSHIIIFILVQITNVFKKWSDQITHFV